MSRITTCPQCAKRIQVPEGITWKTLICPHCLADVDNAWPRSQIRAADLNTDVKRGESMGSIILAVLMGHCVLGIVMAIIVENPNTGMGLLMISCASLCVLVSIAIFRWRVVDIDTDVKHDLKAGNIVLTLLTGLCVLGVATALFVVPPGESKVVLMMFTAAPLCVLIPIAIMRRGSASTCGIVFLVLGTIMAIFIFFFFTCLMLAFRPHH